MSTSNKLETNTEGELWLCLHFPLLPIEVFCRQEPSARNKEPSARNKEPSARNKELSANKEPSPVVVLERQRVAFLNQAAHDIGIRQASSMGTAYTISDEIICFERDEQKEKKHIEHLAQWAYQFTPCVSISAPHSLLLEISGCLKLFGGISNLKRQIRLGLANLGYTVVAGVNRTALSALCFAKAGMDDNTGNVESSLSFVPIHLLAVDEKIIEGLHQMGITSCSELFALPVDGLNRRYGVLFTEYLDRLTGKLPDPRKFISDKPVFSSEITFLTDVTDLNSLLFPIKRLLGELHDFLRGRQLQINQFSLRLAHRSHPSKTLNILLANPDNDSQMFLMLTQLKLDGISDMPEVDSISLHARQFFETEGPSGDLFHGTRFQQKDGRTHSKAEAARAVRLINMMTARLGRDSCFGLSLANDHRPELAWKPVALQARDYWHMDVSANNPRPVYLLAKPRLLNVRDNRPCLSGDLCLLEGPERIDFGWWDNNEVNRDYYIARNRVGAVYWVYHQVTNNQWYLHGIFS